MTRISFLVPTFNRAGYISESLSAICTQMGADDELLVIDDGSTDDTREIVAGLDPRIRYIHQENAGKSAALNRGMAQTDGEFVLICDDDDVLRPGAVAALYNTLIRSAAGFVFARYTRFSSRPGERRDLGTGYWPDLRRGNLPRHIFEDAFVMQNAALVRRSAYHVAGPFSEAMMRSIDYEMFVRLAATVTCAYLEVIAFDQRKHDGDRGPSRLLHSAAMSDNVWQQWDRLIFENLHRHVPIGLFEAMFTCAEPALLRRAALLQRAVVMARHHCWQQAERDLAEALKASRAPLDAGEKAICSRMLNGKHGPGPALEPRALRFLARMAGKPGPGREIVAAIMAGAMWRVRRGSRAERRAIVTALARLGLAGLAPALVRAVTREKFTTGQVSERSSFPANALLGPGEFPPVTSPEALHASEATDGPAVADEATAAARV
ncbi:MAG: glycosyltransferase family 2 protein [Novosphingobium sp.]